jgi:hypothetical protein
MEQRKMIDIPLGTTVRSSLRAPIDGVYEFGEHLVASDCKPAGEQASLYKFRGELLPPCPKCGKRGVWKLAEYKFEIPPNRDRTEWVLKTVRGDRPDVDYPSGAKK